MASSGDEAIRISQEHPGDITLLLTNLSMPGISGIELARTITGMRPKIKVLLMSGFPKGMLVLNEGWHFMAKHWPVQPNRFIMKSAIED